MKFCDGGRRWSEVVAALFPRQVYESYIDGNALMIYGVHQSPTEVLMGD